MAQHKHWSPDHPFYDHAPWCVFPTKKACDENWTRFVHGHPGQPCVKEIQESKTRRGTPNKTASCTLIERPEHGQSFDQLVDAAYPKQENSNAVH